METRWLYTNPKDFPALREASEQVCVIPVGCVEKHGLHLPLGTDMIHVSVPAYMASQMETVTVAPDFWLGDVPGAQPEGGMTFDTALVTDLLENLCDQIGAQGFRKIVLYNGHGGNGALLHGLQRRLENKKKPYALLRMSAQYPCPFAMGKRLLAEGYEAFPELTKEECDYLVECRVKKIKTGHACLVETAPMMGICPENVHLEYLGIESGQSTERAQYLRDAGIFLIDDGWEIDYPNFYCGDDPVGCTENIGKVALRLEAERLAHVFRLLKKDENILKWHRERVEKLR